jgi:SPP1 family phage portal protein
MEQSRLNELLTGDDTDALITALKATVPADKQDNIKTWIEQYNPEQHEIVLDPEHKRPDKTINGTKISYSKLPIPFQQLIVNRRAAFLAANPVQLDCTPANDTEQGLLDCIKKIWEDNKLDYDTKKLAKLTMSETESAEIWYTVDVDSDYWAGTAMQGATKTLRMQIIANSLGDSLYPVFDARADLIAFGRGYNQYNDDNELIEHFDIYLPTAIYRGTKEDGKWAFQVETITTGKISIIYYAQDKPEWHTVQRLIDRKEQLTSNHADTNDRLGNPMLVSKGDVTGLETDMGMVRVMKLEGQDADLSILSWNNAPASIELEMKNLRSYILDFTDTPDISFEQMKALGDISGKAMKFLFLAAHLSAADKEEIFGKCLQRRLNYIRDVLVKLAPKLAPAKRIKIKPIFTLYLPQDDAGDVDLLVTAKQGGIMSTETAVKKNPLIEDAEAELAQMKKETEVTQQQINNELNTQQ